MKIMNNPQYELKLISESGEPLKKFVKVCKNNICTIYETFEDGHRVAYVSDERSWFQRHLFEIILLIISLILGSILIPKLL